MIIRVIEYPLDMTRRMEIFRGCADEFSKQSNDPDVWQAIDDLKHNYETFATVRGPAPEHELLYFIEAIK